MPKIFSAVSTTNRPQYTLKAFMQAYLNPGELHSLSVVVVGAPPPLLVSPTTH